MFVLLLWLLCAAAVLFAVAAPLFVIARMRFRISRTLSAVLASIGSLALSAAALWTVNECQLDNFMKPQLAKMLAPDELRTLRGEDLFCSTTYSFERRGKRATAVVVSGLIRSKIYIADDRGSSAAFSSPAMQRYLNLNGDSGVTRYEIADDHILVEFRGKEPPYRYSYAGAGKEHVDRMKALAIAGRDLCTYINQNAHDLHDRDWQG